MDMLHRWSICCTGHTDDAFAQSERILQRLCVARGMATPVSENLVALMTQRGRRNIQSVARLSRD